VSLIVRRLLFTLLLGLAASSPALAGDGIVEINQTCAVQTGCVPGDSPGFPVQLGAAGSYRLTGNLTVPAGSDGITLANGVDLDLAGFEIAGPVSCVTGCPAPSAGTGVISSLFGGNQCSVANGKIRGFGLDGISLGLQARVDETSITDVARHGLNLGGGSFASGNRINRAGENGMRFAVSGAFAPSLYRDNTIANTGAVSVVGGRASGPNVCPDRICGTRGRKFFYLTPSMHDGSQVLAACSSGYHMASLWEIFDLGEVEYENQLGHNHPGLGDQGDGPPAGFAGYVQMGRGSTTENCVTWATSSAATNGMIARLNNNLRTATAAASDPWLLGLVTCNTPQRVWCVQD